MILIGGPGWGHTANVNHARWIVEKPRPSDEPIYIISEVEPSYVEYKSVKLSYYSNETEYYWRIGVPDQESCDAYIGWLNFLLFITGKFPSCVLFDADRYDRIEAW